MFDLNKMKKNLKSNYINLPKHDTIDERVNWLMYKFKNIKLLVVNYITCTRLLTLLNFLKDSSFGRGTRYIIFEFFKKVCNSFQLFNSK